MKQLTIVILTYNEEANIERCLDSLATVQAPVFVVDSFSKDRTLDILEQRGIPYVQHVFKNYAAQRNWAQANLPNPGEWVLHLDAGERLTPGMAKWINESFDPDQREVDGYMFARRAIFMDRWIKYGGYHPIYHLRLYRRHLGHCENKVYDQHFVVDGETAKASKDADLEDGVMSSLRDFTVSHARWAVFEAVESILAESDTGEVNARLMGNPIERKRWLKSRVFQRSPLFLRSFMYLFHRYIIKLGFLDGKEGLIFHFLQGFWFRFLVDSTIFEIKQEMKHRPLEEVVRDKYDLDVNLFLNREPATVA
ncbi:glycosyltransferase involved in cell wall biosynthesis [Lewinella aquimaris]|uniref:Glycosyltransferase involved in cell wall biosynthesis n=1 Tax=Neolewinella aquimaris TaxID=1835722 RepID=A0A840E1P6_9BACT|nr:glycosyltransferase family 2 protein [Neolewinella aquimaris]MBB4079020.1 glycosyltransferase involved in cell wall biosynthesis [Neolewinella aquimaris]